MKTLNPFAFARDGKFATPILSPFISVYGLNYLNSVSLDPTEKKAVDALNAAVQRLAVHKRWFSNFTNDAPAEKLIKINKLQDNSWTGMYYIIDKDAYTVIDLGSWGKTYTPEHGLEKITAHPNNFGWSELETLQPYATVLRKISKKYEVNIEVKLIERIRKYKEALDANEMSIRAADSFSDFGRAEGFAVFLGSGYADFQWSPNTIEKAKLFGSENLARAAIKTNRANNAVVVKVETTLKEICDTTSVSALHDALAALQKERLENALQTAELETLRAHVARMENQMGTDNTNKRKM